MASLVEKYGAMHMDIRKRMTKQPSRRTVLKSLFLAGAAPWVIPSRVLGLAGQRAPSNQITLGVLGVGSQGQWDLRAFLNHDDVLA